MREVLLSTARWPLARRALASVLTCLCLGFPAPTPAEQALVAVATNFFDAMQDLKASFEQQHDHTIRLASGASGKLFAQISHGAPFDALLAADQEYPRRLVEDGRAVDGTQFTYAKGKLVLWTRDKKALLDDSLTLLQHSKPRLAIANPALAPYGVAALATLASLHLDVRFGDALVMGENVGQTFAMVATGNVPFGFVALSQAIAYAQRGGAYVEVPADYYPAIRQDAVLLNRASENAAAHALLDYLRSPQARKIISEHGYGVE